MVFPTVDDQKNKFRDKRFASLIMFPSSDPPCALVNFQKPPNPFAKVWSQDKGSFKSKMGLNAGWISLLPVYDEVIQQPNKGIAGSHKSENWFILFGIF